MVWVAADCEFENNQDKKIENWNRVVENNDDVLILGHFFNKFDNDTKELLSRLKGKKAIIDYKSNEDYKNIQAAALIDLGFIRANLVYCYTLKDDFIIHIVPNKERLNCFEEGLLGASARSITGQKNILEKGILSLSYCDWDNTPIDYSNIPYLYQSILKFNQI